MDWRWHNAVTAVKDQGSCGSCWTFGACAALEGAHAIKTNQLLTFSEQFFLDCVPVETYECEGCNGGWAAACYDWGVATNNFLILEADYKYEQEQNTSCYYNSKDHTKVLVESKITVTPNTPSAMKD